MTSDLNWYDLYQPASDSPLTSQLKTIEERKKTVIVGGKEMTYISGRTKAEYTPWVKHFGDRSKNLQKVEAESLSAYINDPATRKALNIPDTVLPWNQCVSLESPFVYHY